MPAWLNEVCSLFRNFFERPALHETGVVVLLCLLFGAYALSRVGTALGSIKAFFSYAFLLILAGVPLLIAAMATPVFFGFHSGWVALAAAGVVLAVVVLPLTVFFLKGGYFQLLVAWTVALLAIGAIFSLEPIVVGTLQDWSEKSVQIQQQFK